MSDPERPPPGIKSVTPLNCTIGNGAEWLVETTVALMISNYLVNDSRDMSYINTVAISGAIREGLSKAETLKAERSKATTTDDALRELLLSDKLAISSWTTQDSKPLNSLISSISMDRYARTIFYAIGLGDHPQKFVVLAASPEKMIIVDPHSRHPFTGGPPNAAYCNGVVVELSNYLGIGNYLHNYGGEDMKYTATTFAKVIHGVPIVKKEEETDGPKDPRILKKKEEELVPMNLDDDDVQEIVKGAKDFIEAEEKAAEGVEMVKIKNETSQSQDQDEDDDEEDEEDEDEGEEEEESEPKEGKPIALKRRRTTAARGKKSTRATSKRTKKK